jgi:hypothetical protein
MAAKRKTKNKQTRSKRTIGKKVPPMKKLARKSAIAKKKSARRKPAVKTRAVGKKTIAVKAVSVLKRGVRGNSQTIDTMAFSAKKPRAPLGGQSGDLQGLSNVEGADSESVDELIQEGNAFEADVVTGVEEAGNADEREVRTREVPEDDVPGEYLEKD